MADVIPQPPTPTGTAGADLLRLQLSESIPPPAGVGSVIGFGQHGCDQVLDHLDSRMIEFAGRMEMAFVTTADDTGECDSSLRAGPPGFVHVIDDRTMAFPQDRGSVSDNAQIRVLMVDFTADLTGLHVNGTAAVVADSVLRGEHPELPVEAGDTPQRWVLVHVVDACVHHRDDVALQV